MESTPMDNLRHKALTPRAHSRPITHPPKTQKTQKNPKKPKKTQKIHTITS